MRLMALALLPVLSGCAAVVATGTPPERPMRSVTYIVSGTAKDVGLVIADGRGGSSSKAKVPVASLAPIVQDMPAGSIAQVSVQNQGDAGDVACEIRSDGVLLQRATGEGPFEVAMCTILVP